MDFPRTVLQGFHLWLTQNLHYLGLRAKPIGRKTIKRPSQLLLGTRFYLTPANRGKHLFLRDIRNLLDQGPSYEELCSIFEAKGFVFERAPFAQRLLAAVPRLKKQQPTYQPYKVVLFLSRISMTTSVMLQYNLRRQRCLPLLKAAPFAPRQEAHPKPQSRAAPAHTKEQNAKKRTFNEIVDLTAGMDSDEELDRQRAEMQRKLDSMKSSNNTDYNTDTRKKTDKQAMRSSPPFGSQTSAPESDEDVTGLPL